MAGSHSLRNCFSVAPFQLSLLKCDMACLYFQHMFVKYMKMNSFRIGLYSQYFYIHCLLKSPQNMIFMCSEGCYSQFCVFDFCAINSCIYECVCWSRNKKEHRTSRQLLEGKPFSQTITVLYKACEESNERLSILHDRQIHLLLSGM